MVNVSSQQVPGRGIRKCKGLRQAGQMEGHRRGQCGGRMSARRRVADEFKEIGKHKIRTEVTNLGPWAKAVPLPVLCFFKENQ